MQWTHLKWTMYGAILMVLLGNGGSLLFAGVSQDGPCPAGTKAEERACFAQQQAHMNQEVDALSARIAAKLLAEAAGAGNGSSPDVASSLRTAAQEVTKSQTAWKAYRDQYCHAVMHSFPSGVGAEAAYDACLYDLAASRLKALRTYFADGDEGSYR